MKILTFLVITLFSCMTAHAAERKWRSLAGVMYLDENSVVVTNEPKLVGGVSKSMLTLNEAIIDVKKG